MRYYRLTKLISRLPCGTGPPVVLRKGREDVLQKISLYSRRTFSTNNKESKSGSGGSAGAAGAGGEDQNKNVGYGMAAIVVGLFGLSYASVPLYKAFCQMTGFGGTTQKADFQKATSVKPVDGSKIIKIYFTANVHSEMPWTFRPAQTEVKVVPGETALAFYTVKNKNDFPVTGVATYNVHPPKAGLYFNKIQCFCFEEQRLGPNEEIDMPVFFFVDPEFLNDQAMDGVNNITLSYTFFKTGDERIEQHREQLEAEANAAKAAAVLKNKK